MDLVLLPELIHEVYLAAMLPTADGHPGAEVLPLLAEDLVVPARLVGCHPGFLLGTEARDGSVRCDSRGGVLPLFVPWLYGWDGGGRLPWSIRFDLLAWWSGGRIL